MNSAFLAEGELILDPTKLACCSYTCRFESKERFQDFVELHSHQKSYSTIKIHCIVGGFDGSKKIAQLYMEVDSVSSGEVSRYLESNGAADVQIKSFKKWDGDKQILKGVRSFAATAGVENRSHGSPFNEGFVIRRLHFFSIESRSDVTMLFLFDQNSCNAASWGEGSMSAPKTALEKTDSNAKAYDRVSNLLKRSLFAASNSRNQPKPEPADIELANMVIKNLNQIINISDLGLNTHVVIRISQRESDTEWAAMSKSRIKTSDLLEFALQNVENNEEIIQSCLTSLQKSTKPKQSKKRERIKRFQRSPNMEGAPDLGIKFLDGCLFGRSLC